MRGSCNSAGPHDRVVIRHRGCATFPEFVLVQAYVVFSLLGAVGTVAGVAKTWKNVGVFVKPLVDRGEPDRNVRVNATHALDAFRRAEPDVQPDAPPPEKRS
jgi:hypothetical protein